MNIYKSSVICIDMDKVDYIDCLAKIEPDDYLYCTYIIINDKKIKIFLVKSMENAQKELDAFINAWYEYKTKNEAVKNENL